MFTIATSAVFITMIIVNYKTSQLEQSQEKTKTIDVSLMIVAMIADLILAAMVF